MYERFTDKARQVMVLANEIIRRCGQEFVHAEHILLALIEFPDTVARKVLAESGGYLESAGIALEALIRSPEHDDAGRPPTGKRVIEGSIQQARGLGHDYIRTEHVLLALLRETDGPAASVLAGLGLTYEPARKRVLAALGNPKPPGPLPPLDRPSSPD